MRVIIAEAGGFLICPTTFCAYRVHCYIIQPNFAPSSLLLIMVSKKFSHRLLSLQFWRLWRFLVISANQEPQRHGGIHKSSKGEKLELQSCVAKCIFGEFWATSCATCIAEMPEMIRTYEKYRAKGFDYVAVAMSHDPPIML